MSDKYKHIAHLLCQLSEQVLWQHARDWIADKAPKLSFSTRVGGGMATYCLYNPNTQHCKLNFGKKMVASKFNANEIKYWLTTREIKSKAYFNQEITLANVLAHTACHEFAHLIQQIKGWHTRGSVHNAGFYKILGSIHQSGFAHQVRDELVQQCHDMNIKLQFDMQACIQPELDLGPVFKPMDTVCFTHKGISYIGVVERVNKKSVTVLATDGISRESLWRVHPNLLQPLSI